MRQRGDDVDKIEKRILEAGRERQEAKELNYKVIFNGSPKQFLKIISNNGININTSKQIWEIK